MSLVVVDVSIVPTNWYELFCPKLKHLMYRKVCTETFWNIYVPDVVNVSMLVFQRDIVVVPVSSLSVASCTKPVVTGRA